MHEETGTHGRSLPGFAGQTAALPEELNQAARPQPTSPVSLEADAGDVPPEEQPGPPEMTYDERQAKLRKLHDTLTTVKKLRRRGQIGDARSMFGVVLSLQDELGLPPERRRQEHHAHTGRGDRSPGKTPCNSRSQIALAHEVIPVNGDHEGQLSCFWTLRARCRHSPFAAG
jgi:hypothetical protein